VLLPTENDGDEKVRKCQRVVFEYP
jgi:hypothetical protein